MNTSSTNEHAHAVPLESPGAYRKPRLRKIKLAAEEVLTTGCKMAGTCDQPFDPIFNPMPTGAGS
jgi:hypothetical protein